MNLKKYIDLKLFGVLGSILMIISQFIVWYSGMSMFEIYLIMTSIALEDSFLFLLPLIRGSISLVGYVLILIKEEYRVNSVIIIFIGLGFFLIFLIELIPQDFPYLSTAELGFYLSIAGAMLILLDIVNILILNKNGDVQ